MECERCGKSAVVHCMSFFNTDLCCLDCIEEEKTHPDYAYAVEIETAHVRAGNVSFSGVGWPGLTGRIQGRGDENK
jgi:hypothetical protein